MAKRQTFYEVLTAAIADMTEHGYDSAERVAFWIARIREAAAAEATPEHILAQTLNESMRGIYRRLVEQGRLIDMHPGVSRFTIERVKPELRAELDRRILASANLIKLNRSQAIEKTLQRFSGWSTSIPAGGTRTADRVKVKTDIRKSLAQLPYAERRVLIDQGHKLTSALSETLARSNNAIAARWHSHFRQAGYDYREDHRELDSRIFAVRGNWAIDKGLMKVGSAGYTDQAVQPAELPFCRCYYEYLYALRALPDDMLTVRGREALKETRVTA